MTNITINQLPTANSIDPTQDILPIYTASATATQGINRNTLLGLASAPVGLTDSQTLTSKTLTSPTINGATLSGTLSGTYTIGGTPTFPSSVVTLTGTQTLTNKTFTSPTINSPTITNATISADTLTGFTTSGSGTIYGLSVAGGAITTSGYASSTALQTNAVQANQLATSAITLGYAASTTNFTATTQAVITGLSVGVMIPTGGRNIKITVHLPSAYNTGSGNGIIVGIWSGATLNALTTQLQNSAGAAAGNNYSSPFTIVTYVAAPSAGSIFYTATLAAGGGTAGTIFSSGSGAHAFILVEAI